MALSVSSQPRKPATVSRQDRVRAFTLKYALSCVAATVSETVTYPLDLTKTRLQVQGELYAKQHGPHRGMVDTALGIVREEGTLRLWQGVTPAIYRHIVYTGCRMAFYEVLRDDILGKKPDGSFPVWKAIVGGLTAGGLAQFFASPTDLIKVQLQMEGRRRLEGKKPRVKSPLHAFKKIVRNSGYRGLWKGWAPNVKRAALVNMGDLTTYDSAKHFILRNTQLKDNYMTHFLASCCSGLVAATLSTPADVIKTRIMNSHLDGYKGVTYTSSLDCLLKTVKSEGFLALYKGWLPTWSRMAPWSLIFWLSYEEIRKISGVASF
ncbi:mitochondrial uncoupling protein 4-like [Tubulanus polymorphus]|uniref:mitochondrial uncoupling protein 4-like n=1 Tax=Tubulanus polymorphus TaxID=672921 RepID=UPI003DA4305A